MVNSFPKVRRSFMKLKDKKPAFIYEPELSEFGPSQPPPESLLSNEDRARLGELDQSEIQEWCIARCQALQQQAQSFPGQESTSSAAAASDSADHDRYLRALKYIHNSVAIFNRCIPVDTLTEIFIQTWADEVEKDDNQDYQAAFAFMSVCRIWRSVGLRTPAFWAELLRGTSLTRRICDPFTKSMRNRVATGRRARLETYELWLSRTRGAQRLSLSLTSTPMFVVEPLIPYAASIVSLNVNFVEREAVQGLHALLGEGMTQLEHLSIEVHPRSPGPPKDLIPLTKESVPRLRSLSIVTNFFTEEYIPVPIAASLRALELFPSSFLLQPAMPPGLLSTLAYCQLLETLRLDAEDRSLHWAQLVPHPATSIEFPNLKALMIIAKKDLISHLLSCFRLPPTTAINIKVEADAFRKALPADLGAFFPVSLADRVSIRAYLGQLAYTMGQSRLKTYCQDAQLLSVKFRGSSTPHLMNELHQTFSQFCTVATLSLELCDVLDGPKQRD